MRGALKVRDDDDGKRYIGKILPGQRFTIFYWGFTSVDAIYTRKGKVLILVGREVVKSFPNARNFKNWNYKPFLDGRPVINLGMGYSDIVILPENWTDDKMSDWSYEIKK